ncbi:hypothetical protein QBC34DRAFT_410814 [Podospora aff. communis PSN243]|uniref:UBC core domain-containing protein n=1 Tax=Podospora aff. communis PSN243 TaxID=3040156 RepID=A0AAV9GF89_9PEZI|nr:hypothetical protein QBC34DRAFT_410814 [Podospora aff. communis PSN243]
MAPLRAKLEESLSKINGKAKRRISEESPSPPTKQVNKQAKTMLQTAPGAAAQLNPPQDGDAGQLSRATFQQSIRRSVPQGLQLSSGSPSRFHTSATTPKAPVFSPPLGSSSTNPIDLTSSPPNSPSMADDEYEARMSADLRGLQDHFDRETSSQQKPNLDFDLDAFSRRLEGLRCRQCACPMPITWKVLVEQITCGLDDSDGNPQGPRGPRGSTPLTKNTGFLHPYLQCLNCRAWTCCGGCGGFCSPQDTHHPISASNQDPCLNITWCCHPSRLFLIFAIACGLDGPVRRAQVPKVGDGSQSQTTSLAGPGSQPGTPVSTKGKGVGKFIAPKSKYEYQQAESKLKKGTGYGGREDQYSAQQRQHSQSSRPNLQRETHLRNQKMAKYFCALAILLPSYSRDTTSEDDDLSFDYSRQPGVAFMAARSPLIRKVTELLRQGSVDEISEHHQIYSAVLQLLNSMLEHDDLIPLLYQDQVCYRATEQLPSLTFTRNGVTAPDVANPAENTQSLHKLLQMLSENCGHFLRTASLHMEEFKSNEEQRLIHSAKEIIETAKRLENMRATTYPAPSGKTPSNPEPSNYGSSIRTRALSRKVAREAEIETRGRIDEEAAAWHRENCIREIPDEDILKSFFFVKQAKKVVTGAQEVLPGRMKALTKQITTLRTSLPDGIYVRHGASRLDVLKVLMVGPKGTPYEHGLFEFDMFCPAKFPDVPPDTHFHTTGGGRVSFNPNLYSNGKVCLSLLGTWDGQGWEPNKSTLLQVLVSIQAMILNDQPWYNEPGRELTVADARSKKYNKEIWLLTIEHAMIYWVEKRLVPPANPPARGMPQNPANQATEAQAATAPKSEPGLVVLATFELPAISEATPPQSLPPVGGPVQQAMPLNYNGGQAQALQFGDPYFHSTQFGSQYTFPMNPPVGPGGAVPFGAPTTFTYGPPAAPHAPYHGLYPTGTGPSHQHPAIKGFGDLLPPMAPTAPAKPMQPAPPVHQAPPMQSAAPPISYYNTLPAASSSNHQAPAGQVYPSAPSILPLSKGSLFSQIAENKHKTSLGKKGLAKLKQKYSQFLEAADKSQGGDLPMDGLLALSENETKDYESMTTNLLQAFATKAHAGNTAAVDQDFSKIWGDVIRKHFSLKRQIILDTIKTSPNSGGQTPALSKRLQDALRERGLL